LCVCSFSALPPRNGRRPSFGTRSSHFSLIHGEWEQLSSTSLGSAGCNLNRFGSLSSQLSADRKRPEDSWKRSSELICIQSNAFLLFFFSQMIHNSSSSSNSLFVVLFILRITFFYFF
jgi:hypothetical protein